MQLSFFDACKRFVFAALVCIPFNLYGADHSVSSDDLDALKKEFQAQLSQLQALYEQRITQLEEQIQMAQAQDSVLKAQDSALRAQQAAQKAEEMYSSTIAAKQIQDLAADGSIYPWREIQDFTKGFEFHGMFRTTFGVNGNGGPLQVFQAPGAGGRYTLGNRNDTYGEMIFINHFLDNDLRQDGVKFRTEVLLAYTTKKATADGDRKDDKFSVREVFAEAQGVIRCNPSAKIWAGQRYYLDRGFQINNSDIVNYSGYGCGITDWSWNDGENGKLALAYIGGTFDDLNSDGLVNTNPVYAKNNFVLSVEEFPFWGGDLTAWVAVSGAKGRNRPFIYDFNGTSLYSTSYANTYGYSLGIVHRRENFYGGYNQVSLSFGRGAGSNLSAVVNNPISQVNNSWSVMLSESFTIQPYQKFSLAFVAIAQYQQLVNPNFEPTVIGGRTVNLVTGGSTAAFTWVSLGFQPVYHFNKYVDDAFEGSADWTNTNIAGGGNGILYKGTVALELSPNFSFAAKPIMRLFATAATWSKEYVGLVGGSPYKNDRMGLSIGAAVEASW